MVRLILALACLYYRGKAIQAEAQVQEAQEKLNEAVKHATYWNEQYWQSTRGSPLYSLRLRDDGQINQIPEYLKDRIT